MSIEEQLAEVRAEAARDEHKRIQSILKFSREVHHCDCPNCASTAQDLAFYSDVPFEETKRIVLMAMRPCETSQ